MTTSVHMALGNWLRLEGIQSLLSLPAPPAACPSQGARPTPKWRAPPLSLSLSLSVLSLSLSLCLVARAKRFICWFVVGL